MNCISGVDMKSETKLLSEKYSEDDLKVQNMICKGN